MCFVIQEDLGGRKSCCGDEISPLLGQQSMLTFHLLSASCCGRYLSPHNHPCEVDIKDTKTEPPNK